MARKRKRESVTVSFHYLARVGEANGNEPTYIPFTPEQFSDLSEKLLKLTPLDLSDEKVRDRIRYKNIVPIDKVSKVDERTIFGLYKGSYWGHAYENTDAGQISADSISLRPFYFVLYLSDSGRIYIGAQYLGQFGSYGGLRNTICAMLPSHDDIEAFSFRSDSSAFGEMAPKEVRVHISKKSSEISSDVGFHPGVIVSFKKKDRKDDFEGEVKRRLLPFLGSSKDKVQKAVTDMLKAGHLTSVNDADIEDCTVIGEVNGQRKTIYLIQRGAYASHFPINVTFNIDGHPEPLPTRKAMVELLQKQIIAMSEQ